jgi:hypothetical protein
MLTYKDVFDIDFCIMLIPCFDINNNILFQKGIPAASDASEFPFEWKEKEGLDAAGGLRTQTVRI